MNALLTQFHFLRPWWLLLVLAWLPVLLWRLRVARRGGGLGRLADAALLPHLLVGAGRARRWPWWLAGLAGVLVTLALAGPTWQRLPQPLYSGRAAQVAVVSLSRRMLARDIKPDRMERVRFKVHDLLHANAGGRNGLVAYAGAAFTVAPLTTDAHALDDLVDALAPDIMPMQGNAAAKGIERGARLLEHGGARGGSLVVVTDKVNAAAIAAARRVHKKGIRVSVLGVGTTQGTPVHLPHGGLLTNASGNIVMARRDDASLRALADAGGGIYVPMQSGPADIKALIAELHANHRAHSPATAKSDRWRDMGPWLLLPLLLLGALAFRRGWLLALVLIVALPCIPLPAHATGLATKSAANTAVSNAPTTWRQRWSALWRNGDQRAMQALASGHPQRAEKLARSPAVRGAAAYQAGDYAAAAKAFARAPGANATYNLGNALARQGHYQQAIKAYGKALKQDPTLADARANRKAVREWLRQHKPPPHSGKPGKPGSKSGKKHGPKQGTPKAGQHAGGSRQGSAQAGKNGRGKGPASAASSPAHAPSNRSPASAASARTPPQPTPASSTARAQPAPASSSGKPSASTHPPDVRAAQRQQAEARQASRALRQRMRKQGGNPHKSSGSFDLGAVPAHAGSANPLPRSMQQALERVPDDPGGLLRRKFRLQYQERQGGPNGGGS